MLHNLSMVKIKFNQTSILLGYSYIWLVTQLMLPSISCQNFKEVKQRYFPHDIYSSGRLIFLNYLRAINVTKIKYIIAAISLLHLVCSIIITLESRPAFMKDLGVNYKNSLSYDIVFYAPILRVSVERKRTS